MRIVDIEIRACRGEGTTDHDLRGGRPPFVVVTVRTDVGVSGTSFGFATLNPLVGAHSMLPIKAFFIGRNPLHRERAWVDFRRYNRNWTHSPIYAYGPFDNACWDITGKIAGLPVFELLGAARDRVPTYASSMFLTGGVDAYVTEALQVKHEGFHAYKIHPPGPVSTDIPIYHAVREAVGPDFPLMADPVGSYTYEEALRIGKILESLGYLWLEEPVWDEDWNSQARLATKLSIPIAGAETAPDAHRGASRLIELGAIDILRADVSWRGGITGVAKTAILADAYGLQCELHTAIYHALDIVNLHCAAGFSNSRYLELLYPTSNYEFGIKDGIDLRDGYAHPPRMPGLGIDYDWNYIDSQTVLVL